MVFAEVYDNRPQVEPHSFEPARRSWGHRLDVPLARLGPGQYVLRVEIAPAAGGPGQTAREVPFEVQPVAATSS